jgi:hypothetical protein
MRNASLEAMTAMKNFIISKEKNPKQIPRRQAALLTPDKAATLDARMGLPEKEADSVGLDHTADTSEQPAKQLTKLPTANIHSWRH